MAWRFKASKYKNAAPIVPKPECCVRDIFVGSYQTYGNNIAASAAFMAFNVDHNGSSLGVLPIDDCGRKGKTLPLLHAHTDTVTDLDFSNFHDGLLATGSQDCTVKVWLVGENGLDPNDPLKPEAEFSSKQRRIESVKFHPSAVGLLSTTSANTLTLYDLMSQQQLYSNSGDKGLIQSQCWKTDGSLVSLHTKDKILYILDPRTNTITQSTESHQSIKDSRVVWLDSSHRILTTGFDSARQREVYIRDIRNFSTPEKTLVLDSSTGILMPLYDADTGMLFLAGKGDTSISYMEVTEREPYLVEGLRHTGEQTKGSCLVPKRALNIMQGEVNRVLQLTSTAVIPIMYQVPRKSYRDFHSDLYPDTCGPESSQTAVRWMAGDNTAVAKISLDPAANQLKPRLGPKPFSVAKFEPPNTVDNEVHSNEVKPSAPDRVGAGDAKPMAPDRLELTNDCKSPASDPVSNDSKPAAPDWLGISKENNRSVPDRLGLTNDNHPVQDRWNENKKRLDNGFHNDESPPVNGGHHDDEQTPETEEEEFERGGTRCSIAERRKMYEARSQSVQEPLHSPVPLRRRDSLKNSTVKEEEAPKAQAKSSPPTPAAPKRTSTVFGRVSKYRHLKGTPAHKSLHIENVKNVSRQISGECDGFHGNNERLAMPLGGAGGKIAVLELSKAGKLPAGVLPTLVNGSNVMDFAWDPFNNNRLAVGCDDGTLRLWLVPDGGLTEPTNSPQAVLQAHNEKVYCLRWHPLVADILVTTSYDLTTKVWDLSSGRPAYLIHQDDQVAAVNWSGCGRYLGTVTRGSVIRVYEPRVSEAPCLEGKGPGGSRGARIVWTLNSAFIVVTGFDRVSERQIMVFQCDDLSTPLSVVSLDVSPAILMPFYDEDSSVLFLTGRGDSTIYAYEVSDEAPYLNALSHHRCSSTHQGLAFLPKIACDVSIVEFAKAYRLANTTIEPLSFTVPRIKTELFQDDLFPDTKVMWEPCMEPAEWLAGANKQPPRLCLKPPNMTCLTECQREEKPPQVKQEEKPAPQIRVTSLTSVQDVKQTSQQLEKSVSKRVEINMSLEQDTMEGVDENEWVE